MELAQKKGRKEVYGRSLLCVFLNKNTSCVIDGCNSHLGRKENSGEKIHFHS